ncbi:hypothetical protein BDF14DRAFT_1778694 [Spinellus fusiger]|nr:hypothetical protein BDF14DRAFT_1778694 [Spinellus fusiger]
MPLSSMASFNIFSSQKSGNPNRHTKHKATKQIVVAGSITFVLLFIFFLGTPGKTIKSLASENSFITHSGRSKRTTNCGFPSQIPISKSEDGTFTPPSPDATFFSALSRVTSSEYNAFCSQLDPQRGFVNDTLTNPETNECGTWQGKYKALHERRLEQLERLKAGDFGSFQHEDRPKFVGYICEIDKKNRRHGCGGLADRMTGMVSTFLYALLTDRAYLAYWEPGNPIKLETLFEKPNVDWSYDPEKLAALFKKKGQALLSYSQVNIINYSWKKLGATLFPQGSKQDFNTLWNSSFISMKSNRGYLIRTFQESTRYSEMLNNMGLTKENAFRCFTDFLFRPTIGSRRFIKVYKDLFEMKSVLSIALQIRTDDRALTNPEEDTNTLEQWDYFIKCANDLRDSVRKPHHTQVVYFLVTDSLSLRKEFVSMNQNEELAKRFLGDSYKETTLLVTGLPIEHMEPKTVYTMLSPSSIAKMLKVKGEMSGAVNSALIENWLLSAANYRLISRKGFGKMAAFNSQSPRTTINLPVIEHKEVAVDCSNPHSFITFDTLSTWWSLG